MLKKFLNPKYQESTPMSITLGAFILDFILHNILSVESTLKHRSKTPLIGKTLQIHLLSCQIL
jgi:hypothetical protein